MDVDINRTGANKENSCQGNAETSFVEAVEAVEGVESLNDETFNYKYEAVQQAWLDGTIGDHNTNTNNNNNDDDEHSYLLQYALSEKKSRGIAFHPDYTYAYSGYDKECIVPNMDESQLQAVKDKLQLHVDRLEKKILRSIHSAENKDESDNDSNDSNDDDDNDDGVDSNKSNKGWIVPKYCIPIRADIRKFDFVKLAQEQKRLSGRLFDAIMMDPPWQLATANPTRGVALGYNQLGDNIISSIPVHLLQDNGLLFVWVINAKYRLALSLFKKWGYNMIGDIGWVKQTVNRRIANGHGYYLQHAKETCLIGLKGTLNQVNMTHIKGICSDIIYSERRGQSQKPEEVYQYIEQLIPHGFYMEIFGRRNNLRNGWLTIGNEL